MCDIIDAESLQKKLYFLVEQLQNMAREIPEYVVRVPHFYNRPINFSS